MSEISEFEAGTTLRDRDEGERAAAVEAARSPEEAVRLRRGREAWEHAAAEYVAGSISAVELADRSVYGA